MPTIIIGSQPIAFPDSAASPNWSPAIISFAQAVAAQLNIATGIYDVPAQAFNIDAYNVVSDQPIQALFFPTSAVRAAFIRYSIYRETDSANVDEAGDLIAVYNPNNASSRKWTMSQVKTSGDAQTTFTMTDLGQLEFTTTALPGSSHTGTISFDAKALTQS